MCAYIGIEDLAANALIEILSDEREGFVSYETLDDYGMEVVRILSEKGDKALLVLSRDATREMFRNYSDIFVEETYNGKLGIGLKQGVTVDCLIDKFRGYLSLELLLAFMSEDSKRKLGIQN